MDTTSPAYDPNDPQGLIEALKRAQSAMPQVNADDGVADVAPTPQPAPPMPWQDVKVPAFPSNQEIDKYINGTQRVPTPEELQQFIRLYQGK